LTGRPAGERDEDDRFPPDSVNRLVDDALRHMAMRLKQFGQPAKKKAADAPDAMDAEEADGEGNGEPEPPKEPELPGDEPGMPEARPSQPIP
jgi:hypothetical protein